MSLTLCMQISNPDFGFVKGALESAVRYVQPAEMILTLAPSVLDGKRAYDHKVISRLLKDFKGKLQFFEGTDNRMEVAASRLASYDKVMTDWIINLDDDDMVVCSIRDLLASCGPQVGMFHTDIIGVYMEDAGVHKAGSVLIRRSKQITKPEDGNKFWGSFWGIRRDAWDAIKDRVDRDQIGFNDWRLAWHIINAGWLDRRFPVLAQLQRIRDYTKVKAYQVAKQKGGWTAVCEDLRRRWT